MRSTLGLGRHGAQKRPQSRATQHDFGSISCGNGAETARFGRNVPAKRSHAGRHGGHEMAGDWRSQRRMSNTAVTSCLRSRRSPCLPGARWRASARTMRPSHPGGRVRSLSATTVQLNHRFPRNVRHRSVVGQARRGPTNPTASSRLRAPRRWPRPSAVPTPC